MAELLPVQLEIQGKPFDQGAVFHTLRHFALHAGWKFTSTSVRKLIYATYDDPSNVIAAPGDLVILSSPRVKDHLIASYEPIPMEKKWGRLLPFVHKQANQWALPGWVTSDVVAGAFAVLNLWFEERTRSSQLDGWIKFHEDWWVHSGIGDPFPIVDEWFNYIGLVAKSTGWPDKKDSNQNPFTLVLTHDVDYLPTGVNKGFPRFIRALARQLLVRKNFSDALHILARYGKVFPDTNPYNDLLRIRDMEDLNLATSSFQFVANRLHRFDPTYNLKSKELLKDIATLIRSDWEICLHGSYSASRTPGQLAVEKKILEDMLGQKIIGHRQHYLNFHPSLLFSEVAHTDFLYDMSVGYNDRSGPRAGTFYPYKPYGFENKSPYSFWEFPFLLMDTTLATSYRMDSSNILDHSRNVLGSCRGMVSVIWHQEQCGGLLDPGYDQAYIQLLEWATRQGARLTSPGKLINELETAWNSTIEPGTIG